MIRLEFIKRPEETLVQIFRDEEVIGSVKIKPEEVPLFMGVSGFLIFKQEEDKEVIRIINESNS